MKDLKVHARNVDEQTMDQIRAITSHPAVDGPVSIMPDCHVGAGCVIGFTGRFRDAVIPNVVGVDIGCGVMLSPMDGVDRGNARFGDLDSHIRKVVPLGPNHHGGRSVFDRFGGRFPRRAGRMEELAGLADDFYGRILRNRTSAPALTQLGTLGSGNHFVEVDEDGDGHLFLSVHTGSRNFGYQVAGYFQDMARSFLRGSGLGEGIPQGLEYLPMDRGGRDYMKWLAVAQEFAEHNRFMILDSVLGFYGLKPDMASITDSVHNYISDRDGIVRKGAISARNGEKVVIPLSMSSGIVRGTGRGNPAYNCSAPHGAGRLFGRKEMKRRLSDGDISMEMFQRSMKGIFSTSVCSATIDESPMAYRNWEDIQEEVAETVDVSAILRPVYNLKAAG
ncbi:MAG TPA: RtcB family protein [Synergistales bacterium]|nr:RtcB family protein [Synergistales bacterium]HRV70401.1 RtcB family protein [Thermovirgaceae bacterium]